MEIRAPCQPDCGSRIAGDQDDDGARSQEQADGPGDLREGRQRRDAELAAQFYKEDYIQHNPNVAQGLAGLQDLIRQMHASGKPMRAEIKLMNAEDDMVWLLVEWSGGEIPEGAPRLAQTAEVFRVEDGKLAEHWDVLQFAGKKR